MDLDSLLPPALSESLHIPPWLAWLAEAQFLSAIGPLSAAMRQKEITVKKKMELNHFLFWGILSFSYFSGRVVADIPAVMRQKAHKTVLAETT